MVLHWDLEEEEGPIKETLESARRFTVVDAQRVRVWTLASSVALSFSRRLGAEATRSELAADKAVSKKFCHCYYTLWSMMFQSGNMNPPPPWGQWDLAFKDQQVRKIGTTVIWTVQVDKLIQAVDLRMARLNDFNNGMKTIELQRWWNKREATLQWEGRSLRRIREYIERREAV